MFTLTLPFGRRKRVRRGKRILKISPAKKLYDAQIYFLLLTG